MASRRSKAGAESASTSARRVGCAAAEEEEGEEGDEVEGAPSSARLRWRSATTFPAGVSRAAYRGGAAGAARRVTSLVRRPCGGGGERVRRDGGAGARLERPHFGARVFRPSRAPHATTLSRTHVEEVERVAAGDTEDAAG